MTASGFARAMPRVLAHEGGKVNHPKDPGGRTNCGITQRVYDSWRVHRGLARRDVYAMETRERDAIYRDQYWNAIRGDELPAGIDYVVFDGAVNSGPTRSVRWLQQALGVAVDGDLGPVTLAAAQTCRDKAKLVDDICDIRMAFLRRLLTFATFGRGWTRRVDGVRSVGKAWARGAGAPVLVPPAEPSPKARGRQRGFFETLLTTLFGRNA